MCTGDDCSPAIEPFRRSRVIEGCSLAIKLHISRINARSVDPWIVQVVLSSLDQEDLKFMVEIGQSWLWSAASNRKHYAVRTASRHTS